MAIVTIKLTEGSVQCVGSVVRLLPEGGKIDVDLDVRVRAVKPSHRLDLRTAGSYQFRFDAGGGTGPFKLAAVEEGGAILGTSDHPGRIQAGLALDFRVP